MNSAVRVSSSPSSRPTTGVKPIATPPPPAEQPTFTPSRLVPAFRVEIRRRHDDAAPVDVLVINARTLASARHTAKREHPDSVILSVTRL